MTDMKFFGSGYWMMGTTTIIAVVWVNWLVSLLVLSHPINNQ